MVEPPEITIDEPEYYNPPHGTGKTTTVPMKTRRIKRDSAGDVIGDVDPRYTDKKPEYRKSLELDEQGDADTAPKAAFQLGERERSKQGGERSDKAKKISQKRKEQRKQKRKEESS